MRVLLTNDDGIEAEGLQALRRELAARPGIELEVIAPDGTKMPRYGGNAILRAGPATWRLPLAASDPAGPWQVKVTDILSGATDRIVLPVAP